MLVLKNMGCAFNYPGIVTGYASADYLITLFIITLSADMIALFVSCIVRNPTTAMTVVPFMLIFQLVFAGTFFLLPGRIEPLTNLTLSHWGINSLCAQGRYNELKMTAVWKSVKKMDNMEIPPEKMAEIIGAYGDGTDEMPGDTQLVKELLEKNVGDKPVKKLIDYIESSHSEDKFQVECGKQNQNENFVSTGDNVTKCWGILVLIGAIFAALSVITLEFIDRDKR